MLHAMITHTLLLTIEAKKLRRLSWFGDRPLDANERADLFRNGSSRFLSLFNIGTHHLLHFLPLFYITFWLESLIFCIKNLGLPKNMSTKNGYSL